MKSIYIIKEKKSGHKCMCDMLESMAYDTYVDRYGNHFSEELAAHAIGEMENRTGDSHRWTAKEVEEAMRTIGVTIRKKCWWDAWYLANMAYADYYGSSIKNETDCVRWAADFLNDPDGIEGKAFIHYAAEKMSDRESGFTLQDFI